MGVGRGFWCFVEVSPENADLGNTQERVLAY